MKNLFDVLLSVVQKVLLSLFSISVRINLSCDIRVITLWPFLNIMNLLTLINGFLSWCDLAHPYYPWVRPTPYNNFLRPAQGMVLPKFPQGQLEDFYWGDGEEVCWDSSLNQLLSRRTSEQRSTSSPVATRWIATAPYLMLFVHYWG